MTGVALVLATLTTPGGHVDRMARRRPPDPEMLREDPEAGRVFAVPCRPTCMR